MHDRESIYTIPEEMRQEGLDREIMSILNLHDRVDVSHEDRARERWTAFVKKLTAPKPRTVTIGVTGKYAHLRDAYASIDKAIEHCSAHAGARVELKWIETTEITQANVAGQLAGLDGVIVPGGFGARGVEGKIACVRYCRETGLPYLGICLGFQVAVIEFARNVLGLRDASSTEFAAECKEPVISELPEQKKIEGLGGTMRLGGQDVLLTPNSLASKLWGGATTIRERFRHRYEVEPAFIERLEAAGLVFSGKHPKRQIMQVLEIRQPGAKLADGSTPKMTHPFFIGAQYHPELTSRPLHPQPLFLGLVQAAIQRKFEKNDAKTPALQAN